MVTCGRVPAAARVTEAAAAFAADPRLGSVELLDEFHRPTAVLDADAAQLGVLSPGMRVNLDTPRGVALSRAVTRDAGNRFEPLPATDNAGGFTGLVRLERLVQTLCEAGD